MSDEVIGYGNLLYGAGGTILYGSSDMPLWKDAEWSGGGSSGGGGGDGPGTPGYRLTSVKLYIWWQDGANNATVYPEGYYRYQNIQEQMGQRVIYLDDTRYNATDFLAMSAQELLEAYVGISATTEYNTSTIVHNGLRYRNIFSKMIGIYNSGSLEAGSVTAHINAPDNTLTNPKLCIEAVFGSTSQTINAAQSQSIEIATQTGKAITMSWNNSTLTLTHT